MNYQGFDLSHAITALIVPLLGFILRYLHGIYMRLTDMFETWPQLIKEWEGLKTELKLHETQIAKLNELDAYCHDNRVMIVDLQRRMGNLEAK